MEELSWLSRKVGGETLGHLAGPCSGSVIHRPIFFFFFFAILLYPIYICFSLLGSGLSAVQGAGPWGKAAGVALRGVPAPASMLRCGCCGEITAHPRF